MAAPLLEVQGLHAGYGRAEVLSGIAIDAAAGSVVAVVGPNGAGKSTLLNALMGVLPARGDVRFDGEAVQRLSLEERVQRGIALVPETRALFATMPVADNLLLVEHDMDFVMTLTDRIVVVEFGIKLTEGTPDQVREDPAVRAAYLGVEH